LKKSNINIMFTGAGGPVSVSIIKLIREAGYGIVGVDTEKDAVGGLFCDSFYRVPKANHADYIDTILSVCDRERVRLIVPGVDEELIALGRTRDVFLNSGIDIVLSDQKVIEVCNDKHEMFLYLKEKGFPSPNTYLPKEIKEPDILTYPLVVKPKIGRGSRDIYNVNNGNELEFFSRYVNEPIIQEYLGGQEYTVDMLSNRQGKVLAIVPRKRLLSKGVSIKGVVDMNPEIIHACRVIAESLPLSGPSNIQLFLNNGSFKIVEINPRLSGTVILTVMAGLNIPVEIIRMYMDENYTFRFGQIKDKLMIQRYWQEIIQ